MGEPVERNCLRKSVCTIADSSLRSVQKLYYHSYPLQSKWFQESKGSNLRTGCMPFAEFPQPRCNPLRHMTRPGIEKGKNAARRDALTGGPVQTALVDLIEIVGVTGLPVAEPFHAKSIH